MFIIFDIIYIKCKLALFCIMLFVKPLSHCRNCFWFDYGITVPNHVLIKQM